jgi:tape measure domain-containing protein
MFKVDASSLQDTTGTIHKFNKMVDDISVISAVNKLNMLRYAYYTLKATIQGVVDAFGYFVEAGAAQETAMASFTVMLGSESKAAKMLKDLNKLAVESAFSIREVESNASMLLAMGTPADNIIQTMSMLGDITAALPNLTFKRLALNYGQVLSAGVLTGRELRDFITGGVPILAELSKMTGKTAQQIKADISAKRISADMVTEAFQRMTSAGGMFFNMTDVKAKTTGGRLQAIAETWELIARKVGIALNEKLKPYLAKVLDYMNANGDKIADIFLTMLDRGFDLFTLFIDVLGKLSDNLSWFVDNGELIKGAINGIYDAFILLTGSAIALGIGMLTTRLWQLGAAMGAMSGFQILASLSNGLTAVGSFFTVGLGGIFLFGLALLAIILYVEDLFTFFTDPEADSVTKWWHDNSAAGYIFIEMLRLAGEFVAGLVRALFTFDFSQLHAAILNTIDLVVKGIASLFGLENFNLNSIIDYWSTTFLNFINWLSEKWDIFKNKITDSTIYKAAAGAFNAFKGMGGMDFSGPTVMNSVIGDKPLPYNFAVPAPTISSNQSTQTNTVTVQQTINGGNPQEIERATKAALDKAFKDANMQKTSNKGQAKGA